MAATAHRTAANHFNSFREHAASDAKKSKEAPKIWENLLKRVSSGRRLAEKQLLVLGGTPESQQEFLESLSTETASTRRQDRQKRPPVANQFALGYTYQDVLDADQEGALVYLIGKILLLIEARHTGSVINLHP